MNSPAELAALVVVVAMAFAVVAATTRGRARRGLTAALVVGLLFTLAVSRPFARALGAEDRTRAGTPGPGTALGYVSSTACRACHPGEHASFSRTYHRTMTQVASPETVKAPLDGRGLDLDGRTVRLERRGGEVWATLPDPEPEAAFTAEVTRQVLLTTGSHREQAYWVAGRRRGDLRLVPFVYLVREGALLARRDAFLRPPDASLPPVRWASSCIACHAVAGEPRHDVGADAFDTRAAELGVACEACHGPGAAHVERHRDPVARYMQHASRTPDPTIVHPKRLPPERSAAVCGQCHAYAFPRDENAWWTGGYSRIFRAGDALEPSRTLLVAERVGERGAPVVDAPADAIFWSDGAVRVGGREYNGLVRSPCYERGSGERKMTCLSCHSMHDGDPRGQIAPDRAGNRGCTTCHDGARWATAHTHHSPDSAGSTCVACHMPRTSYALLSAVRSHRIDSPRAGALHDPKPNACNLCHLDRSLSWTARWLAEWYGQSASALVLALAREPADDAAGLRQGIAGDAGVRALIADALGSVEAAQAMPGRGGFVRALLGELRQDPYAAVRFIAERSLEHTKRRWEADATGPGIDPERVRALLAVRDLRAITIAE